jgi:hypothetical protein
MKPVLATAIAVLVAAGPVACGGDDKGPTKPAYIEKADALCEKADQKVDDIYRSSAGSKLTLKRAQPALRAVLAEEQKLLTELRALEQPAADKDEIDRIWNARERGVEELEAATRTPETARAYLDVAEPAGFTEATRLAGAYLMVRCEAAEPGSLILG